MSITFRELWKEKKLKQAASPNYGDQGDFWNKKENVDRFFLNARWGQDERVDKLLSTLSYSPGDQVLDIGAGAGKIAVPLAVAGCKVTAVEPSEPMREMLNRYQQSEGVSLTIIPERWEEINGEDIGSFDLVVASYSLAMDDIGEAVRKMNQVSTGWIYLFWFLTSPPWALANRDLWPLLHGGEYEPGPTADILWNALYEMGIYANLAVEPGRPPYRYTSVDEALADFRLRMNCSEEWQYQIIRKYLKDHLIPDGSGYLFGGESFGARIWWNTIR